MNTNFYFRFKAKDDQKATIDKSVDVNQFRSLDPGDINENTITSNLHRLPSNNDYS